MLCMAYAHSMCRSINKCNAIQNQSMTFERHLDYRTNLIFLFYVTIYDVIKSFYRENLYLIVFIWSYLVIWTVVIFFR